jgi:hypothetical protein
VNRRVDVNPILTDFSREKSGPLDENAGIYYILGLVFFTR